MTAICLGLIAAWVALNSFKSSHNPAEEQVSRISETRIRVVWCQDQGSNDDVFAAGTNLVLMGYDSADGKGERAILDEPRNYNKPILSPDGKLVFFTDFREHDVYVVNWNGEGLKRFAFGQVLDTRRDPSTGRDWVYVQDGPKRGDNFDDNPVYRHPIDNLDEKELLWDEAPVSRDNFQFSADETMAGGQFPWPNAGVARIREEEITRTGRGCWTSFAPDNSYVSWIFDGSHRVLRMSRFKSGDEWEVPVNTAPGIDGAEMYHPRWSNHPLYFAITGPYTIRRGANSIRGGGPSVEILVGRFSPDLRTVTAWARISHNERADFFPDVWVDGSHDREDILADPTVTASSKTVEEHSHDRIEIEGKLKQISDVPSIEDIAPYKSAMVVYAYEISSRYEQLTGSSTILVAHWAIVDRETVMEPATPGKSYKLVLERFDAHPELEGRRLIMSTDDIVSPMFYDVSGPHPDLE